MADLNQALLDIRSIRRQVAHATEFRGYGPLALSSTAALAVLAGIAQRIALPQPATRPAQYVALWLITGVLSAALIFTQMLTRANRLHSGMADEMIHMAVSQFLPAGIAGLLLPFVLLHIPRDVFWMLPGLWQIVFSLGVFACCRCLPRPMLLAGVWFLLTGLKCISLGGARSLAPRGWPFPTPSAWRSSRGCIIVRPRRDHSMKKKKAKPEAPFAYEGLDRVIHERARLSVLTSLITHPDGLGFVELKRLCALTDGNLARHLQVLEEDGMVRLSKEGGAGEGGVGRAQTTARITASGRRRYLEYLSILEQVVRDAAAVEHQYPAFSPLKA